MAETTTDRLARLLALVAYLGEHTDVPVEQVASHFGVSSAQVLKDVDTLWVSGTPGYLPDDLIDFSAHHLDDQRLTLTQARGMDRPLRLSPGEAVALLVALRAASQLPGFSGDPVVTSALAKLTTAAGDAASAANAVDFGGGSPTSEHAAAVLATVRDALRTGHRLHLRYVSATDSATARDVDPLELVSDGEHWYLRAWCLRAEALRHFRLDRVLEVEVSPVPAVARELPPLGQGTAIRPEGGAHSVTLTVTPRSRWVAERYGGTVTDDADDAIRVGLDVADPAWLSSLVLALGEDVLAVEPPRYAASIARQADAALAAYGED